LRKHFFHYAVHIGDFTNLQAVFELIFFFLVDCYPEYIIVCAYHAFQPQGMFPQRALDIPYYGSQVWFLSGLFNSFAVLSKITYFPPEKKTGCLEDSVKTL
jgi:hypothetical protein